METRTIALLSAAVALAGTTMAAAALRIGMEERAVRLATVPQAVVFCEPAPGADPFAPRLPLGCTPAADVAKALEAEGFSREAAPAMPMPIAPVKGMDFKPPAPRKVPADIMAGIEEDRRLWAELGVAQVETERVQNSVDELATRIDRLERRQGM